MPIPAYANFGSDIPGSVTITGREDTVEVIAFEHEVRIPVDPHDGSLTGTRAHSAARLLKAFDKSSPMLYDFLCNGKVIPEVLINWYKIDETGAETEYFVHKLENVRIVSIKPEMPNVKIKEYERLVHMEWIELRYEKITWTFMDGNIEATDTWLER